MSREAIYSALFTLIALDTRIIGAFKTMARLTKHFDDVPSELCPALYLLQTGETWTRPGKGMPPKRTLECKFIVYTMPDPTNSLASTIVNAVLDVIDDVLSTNVVQQAVTLGGLVEHVYVEGKIIIDEGLLQSKSVSVIPITILVP